MYQELETTDIQLPTGFTMRPAQMTDVEAVVELLHASELKLTGHTQTTLEEERSEWAEPVFDVPHSVRIIEDAHGRVAAYGLVWDSMPNPVSIWFFGRVHPDYEGLGLGSALHQWAHVRAQDVLGRVPEDVQVVLNCQTASQNEAAHTLFTDFGYEQARFYWRMAIDFPEQLPPVELPAGIVIKSWAELGDSITLRQLVQTKQDSFRDHWGFVETPLDEAVEEYEYALKNDPFFDPWAYFVALDTTQDNAIAGISFCYLQSQNMPTWGYLGTLGVLRPWRRTGLGLALLLHSFHVFHQKGYTRMELHVDAASLTGATRLYEKVGMRVADRTDRYQLVLRHGRSTIKTE